MANCISPEIKNEVLKLKEETHHLRHTSQFLVNPIHSIFNGSESASYLGPKMWKLIPTEIKNKDSLVEFFEKKKKMETPKVPLQNL